MRYVHHSIYIIEEYLDSVKSHIYIIQRILLPIFSFLIIVMK